MEEISSPSWRKSSRCGTTTCVEVAEVDGHYLLRDSKSPEQPALSFSRRAWASFIDGVHAGAFDGK